MDFASVKVEGVPAEKHTLNKYSFWCDDCGTTWISDPQSQRDYFDYVWLRDRTEMIANEMGKDGSIRMSPAINGDELMRCAELANKIITSYKSTLPLPMDEWIRIEEGVR